ncbi:MAG: hypothetical protein AAGI28_11850 [Pseudomonadota bacterium]
MLQISKEATVGEQIEFKASTLNRLAELANTVERNDAELANEALEQYLDYQEWAIAEIKAGCADAEAGRTVSHDAVKAWVASLGTEQVLRVPQSSDI